jgi:hypothetical protein
LSSAGGHDSGRPPGGTSIPAAQQGAPQDDAYARPLTVSRRVRGVRTWSWGAGSRDQAMTKNFMNGDRVLQVAVNPSGKE